MKCGAKGRRGEYKAIAQLEAQGYVCVRAAGSKGVFDLVAISATEIRLLQVKSGTRNASPEERARLAACPVPPGVSKELWRFLPRAKVPLIARL